jgi:hypothetical protein
VDKLRATRRPGESYSDVILRLFVIPEGRIVPARRAGFASRHPGRLSIETSDRVNRPVRRGDSFP